jgi:hypothetical protein
MAYTDTHLDLDEQISRIRRSNEETRKFVAEQHKLMAEAAKLDRDRILAPMVLGASVLGALIAAAVGLAAKFLG